MMYPRPKVDPVTLQLLWRDVPQPDGSWERHHIIDGEVASIEPIDGPTPPSMQHRLRAAGWSEDEAASIATAVALSQGVTTPGALAALAQSVADDDPTTGVDVLHQAAAAAAPTPQEDP